jgi:hypothetical protein
VQYVFCDTKGDRVCTCGTTALGHSRPSWAVRVMSGLPPIASVERTSRFGSFVPRAGVISLARSKRRTLNKSAAAVGLKGGFYRWRLPSAIKDRDRTGLRPIKAKHDAEPGGLRDQLRRKPWPRRSTSWTSITSVAGAILVNAPTLGGWYLLQGQAVAISRTTGIYALLFSGLSRRNGERGEIAVTRTEWSRTQ